MATNNNTTATNNGILQPGTYTAFPTQGSTSTSSGSSWQQGSSVPVDTLDAQLSRLISQTASKYGDQVFNWANSTLKPNQALTDQAVGQYMSAANTQFNLANQTASDYNNIGRPQLANLNNQAGSYSSAARQRFDAGQAEAASVQGSQAGLDANKQALQGFGINPNSGMYAELDASNRAAAGASAAAAGTQAAANTRAQGQALTGQAVAADQQLPGQAANASTAGVGAVSGAVNAKLANTTTAATALDAANPFYSTAQNISPEGTSSQTSGGSQQQSQSQSQTTAYGGAGGAGTRGAATGGAIEPDGDEAIPTNPEATTGGFVSKHLSPSHGAITDDIPARLNADEFVIPKDVTRWYGQKHMQELILKARKAMGSDSQAPAKPTIGPAKPMTEPGFAHGGAIPMSW